MGWWSSVGCDRPYSLLGYVRLNTLPNRGLVEFFWLWLTIFRVRLG
jgi:hypothetical protein